MRTRLSSPRVRGVVAIVLVALAAWIFRGVLLTFVIEPIGWLLWAAWRLLASIDRGVLWLAVIIVCSLLVIRLAPTHLVGGSDDVVAAGPPSDSGDRLAHWRARAAQAASGAAGLSTFRFSLRSMADSVAEVTRTHLPEPLSAPRETQGLEPRAGGAIARAPRNFAQILPDHGRRREARLSDELLTWMESALEIRHGQ